MRFHLRIEQDGLPMIDQAYNAAGLIVAMQEAIQILRDTSRPQFDASFGEHPLPIIGPSADEVQEFINAASPHH